MIAQPASFGVTITCADCGATQAIPPSRTAASPRVTAANACSEEIATCTDAKVVVDARWDRTRHERVEVPIASLESANVASGMSQALATLADRIAAGLAAR
jgi:ribosomal protein S27E